MMINRKNRDKLLGVAAVITFFIGSCNALEYFFAGKKYLDAHTSAVEKVNYRTLEGGGGRLYSKTIINLKGVKREFYLKENAMKGGHIEVAGGDTITIYSRKLFQILYNYNLSSNIFYVEKNDRLLYDNMDQWKGTAFYNMCLFGGCALFLLIMYLDQVKNISISNWLQRKKLKNSEYIKRKPAEDIRMPGDKS